MRKIFLAILAISLLLTPAITLAGGHNHNSASTSARHDRSDRNHRGRRDHRDHHRHHMPVVRAQYPPSGYEAGAVLNGVAAIIAARNGNYAPRYSDYPVGYSTQYGGYGMSVPDEAVGYVGVINRTNHRNRLGEYYFYSFKIVGPDGRIIHEGVLYKDAPFEKYLPTGCRLLVPAKSINTLIDLDRKPRTYVGEGFKPGVEYNWAFAVR